MRRRPRRTTNGPLRQGSRYRDQVPKGTEPELLTARLRLRVPASDDVDAVQRIHQDPAAVAHNPSDAVTDRESATELLERWQTRWRRDGVGYWVVTGRADPAVLGFCGVKPMQLADGAVLNLFYRFDPAAWGRGVATEAVTAVVGWTRRARPGQRLIARIRPGNTASARVAAKAGLTRAADLDTDGEDGPDHIWLLPEQRH